MYLQLYQDGVELNPAYPSEVLATDYNFSSDVEVGETLEVSAYYVLRSENPVEVAFYEFDEVTVGRVFDVK